jgi:hypothetical protein
MVKTRNHAQESAFWGSQRFQKLSMGSFCPKSPKSGLEKGLPARTKARKFSTVHAIFAQNSSIGAAWQNKLQNFTKSPKTCSKDISSH